MVGAGAAPNPKDPEAQKTGWQPRKMVEPEIANAVPKRDQGWHSLTSTNAWGQAQELLSSGLTMQQVHLHPTEVAALPMRALTLSDMRAHDITV